MPWYMEFTFIGILVPCSTMWYWLTTCWVLYMPCRGRLGVSVRRAGAPFFRCVQKIGTRGNMAVSCMEKRKCKSSWLISDFFSRFPSGLAAFLLWSPLALCPAGLPCCVLVINCEGWYSQQQPTLPSAGCVWPGFGRAIFLIISYSLLNS